MVLADAPPRPLGSGCCTPQSCPVQLIPTSPLQVSQCPSATAEARERRGRKRRWGYPSVEARNGAHASSDHAPPYPGLLQRHCLGRQRRGRLLLSLIVLGLGPRIATHVTATVTELSWSSSSPTFPSEATAVTTDASGDLVVCGSWQSEDIQTSSVVFPFVAKFSASGTQRWRRQEWREQAVKPALYGDCIAIDVDTSGDVYLVANTQSDAEGVTTPLANGDTTFAVIKLDGASGALVWRQAFGSVKQSDEATSMRVTDDGAVYVGGFLQAIDTSTGSSTTSEDSDGFVMRLNAATGELMWLNHVTSTNGGDDRVFGIDVNQVSNAVFVVGDTTGNVLSASGMPDRSNSSATSLHGGDLFVQQLDVGSGEVKWSRTIGTAATVEVCRLSALSIVNTDINVNTVSQRRGNCDIAITSGATHVFVTGTTVGGLLSTDEGEQREFQRLCASNLTVESSVCMQALLVRVDAVSGDVQWLHQLVSRAGSSGERVVVLASASSNSTSSADAVMLALADAGFYRVDAMEQLVVLRAAGDTGETQWLADVGGEGPDRAMGLTRAFSSRANNHAGGVASTTTFQGLLVLSSSTRRRGTAEPVTTTLSKLNATSGASVAFCRDAVAFGTNTTAVTRSVTQTLVVVLPVYRVGDVRCGRNEAPGEVAAGITFATIDGSAIGDIDFVPSRGVVQFVSVGDSNQHQTEVAQVVVEVLPFSSSRVPVSFTVQLEAAPETMELGAPFELQVTIEPPTLIDQVQHTAGSGAFWRRLTHWATLAMGSTLVLILGLRVGCGRRIAWARDRMAFEYKSLSLHGKSRDDGGVDDHDDDKKKARAGHQSRWWQKWRWRRGSVSASRAKSGRPSPGTMVGAIGVTRPPPASPLTPVDHDDEDTDGVEDEAALRSHLASIQSLNESLERMLLPPQPSLPTREGPAVVAPAEAPAARPPREKRRGLRRLLRSPRTRRRSSEGGADVERG